MLIRWPMVVRVLPSVVLIALAVFRLLSSDAVSERMDQTFLLLIVFAVLIPLIPWGRLTTFKAAGVELIMEQGQVRGALDSMGLDRIESEKIRNQIMGLKSELQRFQGSRILWIDDRPDNIVAERRLFRALGAEIVPALSSEDAQEKLYQDSDFDLIISDVQREGGESYKFNNGVPLHEGANFITKLRSQSEAHVRSLPVIFYAAYDWQRLVEFTRSPRETVPEPELSNTVETLVIKAIKRVAELREYPIRVEGKKGVT